MHGALKIMKFSFELTYLLICICMTYLFFYFLVIKEGVRKLLGKSRIRYVVM